MAIDIPNLSFYIAVLIILLIAYIVVSFAQLRKYYRINKGSDKKDYLPLTFCLTFLFMGLGRLILAIFDVVTEFDVANYDASNFFVWKIGSSVQLFGVGLWFLLMEKRVMKGRDKYLLIILYTAFIVIGMIMTDIILATTMVILGMFFAVYIPIAYVYIATQSDGSVRRKALLMLFGFLLVIFGSLLPSEQVIVPLTQVTGLLRIQVHDIAFFIIISGLVVLLMGTK